MFKVSYFNKQPKQKTAPIVKRTPMASPARRSSERPPWKCPGRVHVAWDDCCHPCSLEDPFPGSLQQHSETYFPQKLPRCISVISDAALCLPESPGSDVVLRRGYRHLFTLLLLANACVSFPREVSFIEVPCSLSCACGGKRKAERASHPALLSQLLEILLGEIIKRVWGHIVLVAKYTNGILNSNEKDVLVIISVSQLSIFSESRESDWHRFWGLRLFEWSSQKEAPEGWPGED